jgi:hypothetical protein
VLKFAFALLTGYLTLLPIPAPCGSDGASATENPVAEKTEKSAAEKTEKQETNAGTSDPTRAGGDAPDAAVKTGENRPGDGPTEKPKVKREVKLDGEVPGSLFGRWLVVTTLNRPDGPATNASLLEVARGPDGKVNFEHRTPLPAELLTEVKTASGSRTDFTPEPQLLGRIGSSWSELGADVETPPVAGIKYWFVTPDHYTDDFKSEASARDAKAVLIISRFPLPASGGRAPTRTDLFFFIKDLASERLAGPFTNFQLVAGFAPVPVTLQGGFTAYRLGSTPEAASHQAPAAAPASPPGARSSS